MFGLKKPKKSADLPENKSTPWLQRLRGGLKRTRHHLFSGLANIVLGKKTIDAGLFDTLETALLSADVGITTTTAVLQQLSQQVERDALKDPVLLLARLKQQLIDLLSPCCQPLLLEDSLFSLLMVGVNGAGKTTSIAKIAHYFQQQQKKIVLAAGDTFRAAAIEQLQVWGKRHHVPVIAQQSGSDSASVIYDALAAAMARNADLLIADTAGRLHTQAHLMDELRKIKRVMAKLDQNAPCETMLVLDAGTGQNGLMQAKQFNEAIGIDSLTLTKLDGTAKGGVIFAIADQLKLPIRFIGVGEASEDLRPFNAEEFVQALFEEPT